VLPSGADIGRLARHVRLVLFADVNANPSMPKAPKSNWRRAGRTTVPDDCAGHTSRTIVAHGRACSIKRRKRAVKLGGFTALTLPTEGGVFHRKVAGGTSLRLARPSDRSLLVHAEGTLVDPTGHERTGEAHD
jgi:hypothetical protein